MEASLLHYVAFFVLGAGASMLNSIAGGGSVFSLPIMIFLGLPPTVANGTNRIGLIVGNFSSAVTLYRHGYLNTKILLQLLPPTIVGSLVGLVFVVNVSDEVFKVVLAFAIAFVAIMSGLKKDLLGKPPETPPERRTLFGTIAFFLVAIYGGIVQVGVGFVQIFTLVRYTGLDIVHVNAIKNVLTNIFLLISTAGLIVVGKVQWDLAIITAVGALCGGALSGALQIKKGGKFVMRVVRLATVAVALKLFYDVIWG